MISEEMEKIDAMMDQVYDAQRSSVTGEKWIDPGATGGFLWICAYAHLPKNHAEKPTLYMVHYVKEKGGSRSATIVYRSL